MTKKIIFLSSLIALSIMGCAKKGPPLGGKREPILVLGEDLTLSPEVSTLAVTLPDPKPNADWPQAGGEPDHTMSSVILADTFKEIWSTSIGAGASSGRRILTTPIVANDIVYTLDANSVVSAFNTKNGKKLWDMIISPKGKRQDSIGGGLAYAEDRVFVTSAFAEVIALDAKTGQVAWRHQINSPIRSAPIVKDGRVYLISINNHLEVINARNGKPLWSHAGISETASILGGASPAIGSGIVVVPYSSGEVYGLRVENGYPVWYESLTSFKHVDSITSINHIRAQPVIDENTAFLISHSGMMMALDVRLGNKVWSREVGGIQSPAVYGNFMYLISNENKLTCLTKDKGYVKWVSPLPLFKDPGKLKDRIIWAGPLLAGNRLLITGSNGTLEIYSALEGKKIGEIKLPHKTTLAPIVADRTLFILTDQGRLIAYR